MTTYKVRATSGLMSGDAKKVLDKVTMNKFNIEFGGSNGPSTFMYISAPANVPNQELLMNNLCNYLKEHEVLPRWFGEFVVVES